MLKWYRVILTKKYYGSSTEYFVVARKEEEAISKARSNALEDGCFNSGVLCCIFAYEQGSVVT